MQSNESNPGGCKVAVRQREAAVRFIDARNRNGGDDEAGETDVLLGLEPSRESPATRCGCWSPSMWQRLLRIAEPI